MVTGMIDQKAEMIVGVIGTEIGKVMLTVGKDGSMETKTVIQNRGLYV